MPVSHSPPPCDSPDVFGMTDLAILVRAKSLKNRITKFPSPLCQSPIPLFVTPIDFERDVAPVQIRDPGAEVLEIVILATGTYTDTIQGQSPPIHVMYLPVPTATCKRSAAILLSSVLI